jgi:hypothetical protein
MRRRLSRTEASANGRTHNLNLPLETAAMAKTPKTDQHADCDIIRNCHGIAPRDNRDDRPLVGILVSIGCHNQ